MAVDKMELLRTVSRNIPISTRPFKNIAENFNVSEEEIVLCLAELKNDGYIKRIGAVLKHQKNSLEKNALALLKVDPEYVDSISKYFISSNTVSYCYKLDSSLGWTYNLCAILHGISKFEIMFFMGDVIVLEGVVDYELCWNLEELKVLSYK